MIYVVYPKKFKFVLFADDTNILCSGEDLQLLLDEITTEMNKLKRWFDGNKLSLNLNKTKFMIFAKWKIDTQVQIKIDHVIINRVSETKFLGVILDHKISWKPQISHIQSKISPMTIVIMGKSRHILDYKSLYILYCSLLLPYLSYCVEIWGNTYKSNL